MFQSWLRILPVFVVCLLARKKCSVQPGPGTWRWHQPWRDVLILSQEDYDNFNKKQWLQNLEQKRDHYQGLANAMQSKIDEIRSTEDDEEHDESLSEGSEAADESRPRVKDRRAASSLRRTSTSRKGRDPAGSDD